MFDINADRLLKDMRELAAIGRYKTGVDRIAFSDEDIEARHWLVNRFRSAGLDASLDRYGNVLGKDKQAEKVVLIGSHTDTVPKGGWLDGALGVIYGLEIARTLRENGVNGVDVISFQDEEGSYLPFLGSKAFCGVLDTTDIGTAIGANGRSLAGEIARHALPDADILLDPKRHIAYFEAHIEQGPRLEHNNIPVGIVPCIVGMRRFRVTANGQVDHAGTTPMPMRKDAGATLISVAYHFLQEFEKLKGKETVWNIGAITFLPGAANVVPSTATLTVEFRDVSTTVLDAFEASLFEIVATHDGRNGVSVEVEANRPTAPVELDSSLGRRITAAAAARGYQCMSLQSGAGHDAMVVNAHLRSIMMFVPSIGGRSHTIEENTNDADIVIGCQVMADAVRDFLESGETQ